MIRRPNPKKLVTDLNDVIDFGRALADASISVGEEVGAARAMNT